ncbi:MAG: RIP metalloprotease RseP [Myxococcales bacterium]|nr:RIP metalloprotease RseP [Myxococcales bacterium]
MADVLLWILAGGVMVGVLVIVHEAGHYVVARLFGVGTPIFSIGMGPRVFGFRFWETDFRISLLPIGGYVLMAGADAFGEEDREWGGQDDDKSLMSKPVWQRFLVMLAGPAANLILPFILFTGVLMFGEPHDDSVVGIVHPNSAAEELGLQPGDLVVELAGHEVDNWMEMARVLVSVPPGDIGLVYERNGTRHETVAPRSVFGGDRPSFEAFGIRHEWLSTRVGVSDRTSPAWVAGLRPGDEFKTVDGRTVETFVELTEALTPDRSHEIEIHRADDVAPTRGTEAEGDTHPVTHTFTLSPDPEWQPAPTETVLDPWGLVPVELFVGEVLPDSAAATAGVKRGDRLMAIDGTRIASWNDVLGLVSATTEGMDLQDEMPSRSSGCGAAESAEPVLGRALTLDLVRDGQPLSLEFQPKVRREVVAGDVHYRPIMGVKHFGRAVRAGDRTEVFYTLSEAVPRAVEQGNTVLERTFTVLGNLVRGKLMFKESIGGPIEIVRTAGYAAKEGVHTFVRVMGMISFSLGIINLLPVPVLDGGQILFYAVEGIRGRPLPLVLRERIQMVGVLFLAALMVMVIVMDIGRWLEG